MIRDVYVTLIGIMYFIQMYFEQLLQIENKNQVSRHYMSNVYKHLRGQTHFHSIFCLLQVSLTTIQSNTNLINT